MKNLTLGFLLVLFTAFGVKAQTYYGSVNNFAVNSGWNVVPNSATTNVNFTVRVDRMMEATGNWNWKPFNMNFRIGLALAPGTALIEYLSPVYNISGANFGQYNAFHDATFSFSVPSNKLLDDYHLVLYYNIPNNGSTYYQHFTNGAAQINNPPPGPVFDPVHIAKIQSMGFSTTGIVNFSSTHYLVEGDVLIKKSSLNLSNPVHTVNNDKEHNVNILLDQSILSHNLWPSAILTAVEVWNSTPNSNIKLNIIYSDKQYVPSPSTNILIKGDQGLLASTLAAAAEFPNGDGKSGNSILINSDFKDPSTNLFISHSKAARKIIHAIGHTLGLKHNSSSNSIMNGSTGVVDLEVYPILHNYDVTLINTLYPLNANSLVEPYIGGDSNLYTNGQFTYVSSYVSKESGVYYKWELIGINGTNYSHEFTDDTDGILSEMSLANPGSYQLKCTILGGKYSSPVTTTKNIVVQ